MKLRHDNLEVHNESEGISSARPYRDRSEGCIPYASSGHDLYSSGESSFSRRIGQCHVRTNGKVIGSMIRLHILTLSS